jgi:hypothetical protein
MIEVLQLLREASEAVSLAKSVAAFVRDTKKEKGPRTESLGELVLKLQLDAVRASRDFENRVRTLRDALAGSGVKMDLSPDDNSKTLSGYDFASRYRLKQLREEMRAVARQFTMFVDDVTSVSICRVTVFGRGAVCEHPG